MGRNIFLYLALVCFIAIVVIFVFVGYLGIYDTVYVTTGEYTQEIGPDFWQGQSNRNDHPYRIRAEWGEPVHFRYQIDNRRFSSYSTTVEASLWKSGEKVIELFSQNISISNFDKAAMDWTLSPQDMQGANLEVGQYTMKINRGEVGLGDWQQSTSGIYLSWGSWVACFYS